MVFRQRHIQLLWQRALRDTNRATSPCSTDLVTAYARLVKDFVEAELSKEASHGRHLPAPDRSIPPTRPV